MTPDSPYPHIITARGHMLDNMGIAVRHAACGKGKGKARLQLLPEEALYLLERGSLQIWIGPEEEVARGVGEWRDEDWGVRGAIEMSVMEGFAAFIGRDELSWERYQVRLVISAAADSRRTPTSGVWATLSRDRGDSCRRTLSSVLHPTRTPTTVDCRHSGPGG